MFISGKPLQSILIFVGMPGAYPWVEHLNDESVGYDYTRVEKLAVNKHSSLFRTFVTYASEKFYNIETC